MSSKENIFHKFVFGPLDFPFWTPLIWITTFLSVVFGLIVKIRLWLYRHNFCKSDQVDAKVISVGNLTTGGTGKTPFVIYLADFFTRKGFTVATISRGYKAESDKVVIVSDGTKLLSTPQEAGDEPFLIAQKTSGVIVLACRNRVKAAKFAIAKFDVQVIILDDAFQHLKIRRDLDIVILDASNPLGNGKLIPRGILREPIRHIKRCHVAIFNKYNSSQSIEKNEADIRRITPSTLVLKSFYTPAKLESSIAHKKVLAVSAIGNPQYFYQLIENTDAQVIEKIVFPDHHSFGVSDKTKIEIIAAKFGADMIVVTEKDWVKLQIFNDWSIPIIPLPIQLCLLDCLKLHQFLNNFINS